MPELVLIRHGQSVWNAENRFTGWTDVDLSEKGVLEAETAGDSLADIRFDVVHTSGLRRAQRTAEIIIDRNYHSKDAPVFRDERLKSLFCSEQDILSCLVPIGWAYHGDYQLPPRGGSQQFPAFLSRALESWGAPVVCGARVEEILVERGKAIGVRTTTGDTIRAHQVVSNADPHATWDLLDDRHLPAKIRRRLRRTDYSLSSLTLFMATRMDLTQAGLDSGNVWWSRTNDLEHCYDVGDAGTIDHLNGMFLTATTLKDPSKYRGEHTLEAIGIVPYEPFARWAGSGHDARPAAYERYKEHLTEIMLQNLEAIVPGLRDQLTLCELGTPLTNDFYCRTTRGNMYGTEKRLGQLGPLGWPVKTPVRDLWMCGASTLGHGVMGATVSGLVVAGSILGCSRREILHQRTTLQTLPCDNPTSWPSELQPRHLRRAS